jgi:hypothetical protein
VAAQVIRKMSGEGQFAGEEDIREEITALGLFPVSQEEGPAALAEVLAVALARNPDLAAVRDRSGSHGYYSSQFMTGAYAGLLLRCEGDPLRFIAATVRENSALYPRPLPLGAFERHPFAMPRADVLRCLEQMAARESYQDIARTRTSAGTEFLYSTTHLDPDYAAVLAEWIDVGQYDNP